MPGNLQGHCIKNGLPFNDDENGTCPKGNIENLVPSLEHRHSTNLTDQKTYEQQFTHPRACILPRDQNNLLRHGRHCRGAIQETAQSMETLTNLFDIFPVLQDHANVLDCLHGSGWVHRDISAGSANGSALSMRGPIGDLEYAKKVTTDGSHEMRTGTPDFMAIEVSKNTYLFKQDDKEPSEIRKRAKLRNEKWRKKAGSSVKLDQPIPFVQNEAHDIESLWWISIYTLFFNRDECVEEIQEGARTSWMTVIFLCSNEVSDRIAFFQSDHQFALGTSWFPSSFYGLRDPLYDVRSGLIACYRKLERMLPKVADGLFDDLYSTAINSFETCMYETTSSRGISSCGLGIYSNEFNGMPGKPQ